TDTDHYDWYRRRRRLGRFNRRRAVGGNKVNRAPDELAYDGGEAVGHALAVSVFVIDTVAFDVAELAQGLAEAMPHRRVVNDSNARYTRRLLRAGRDRPRRRCADKRDEVAPFHGRPSSGLAPHVTIPLRNKAAVHHSKNCALMSHM